MKAHRSDEVHSRARQLRLAVLALAFVGCHHTLDLLLTLPSAKLRGQHDLHRFGNCTLNCNGGACLVDCGSGDGSCNLTGCTGAVTNCPGNVKVCGRPCP